jgi:hypothetical protein
MLFILTTNSTNGNKLLLRFKSRAAQSRMLTASITGEGILGFALQLRKITQALSQVSHKMPSPVNSVDLAALLQAAFNGLLLLVNCEGCFIIRIT